MVIVFWFYEVQFGRNSDQGIMIEFLENKESKQNKNYQGTRRNLIQTSDIKVRF